MSTKALRKMIDAAARCGEPVMEALAEVEAIEKAAKVLSDTLAIHSADERAAAHELMERIAKEAK